MAILLSLDEDTINTRLNIDPNSKPPVKIRLSAKGDTEVEFLTSLAKWVVF